MLPHVYTEYRSAFHFCYIHEWIVLIGCRADHEFFVSAHAEPCPARAKARPASFSKIFLKFIKPPELRGDRLTQRARWSPPAFSPHDLPKEAVFPVATAVIAYSSRILRDIG